MKKREIKIINFLNLSEEKYMNILEYRNQEYIRNVSLNTNYISIEEFSNNINELKKIYLISDDFLKLPVKRNILINEVNQIYDKEVEDLIGSNLILKYTMTTTMLGYMNIDIELTKIEEKEIPMTNLEIPKFIEDKDYKRINKDSERFKFYKIVN